MAEMAEMGYLQQPHTSAGRIPTDRGYRYYVDEMMDAPTAIPSAEAARAKSAAGEAVQELEDILVQTCRILTGLTSYTSIATDPRAEITSLRRVYLSGASPRHVLMVVLLSTGQVEHRLVDVDSAPAEAGLLRISNFLNSQVGSRELSDVARRLGQIEVPPDLVPYNTTLSRLNTALTQLAATMNERRVYVEGKNQLLRQPEFQDVQRLETLLNALEARNALHQALRSALAGADISIVIGGENRYEPMKDCSVVTTSYSIGDRPAGYIGVVGPTRMNYDRAVAAVRLMAMNLSDVLTGMSMA
jgi:heat-inducible transcriptional repressor